MATKKHSDNQGKTGKIGENLELIIGRVASPNLDIELDNDLVSGKHLKLLKIGSMVILEDLGSTNGTTIDGIPLRQGEQKPISLNSQIILAQNEKLDLKHPKIKPFFDAPAQVTTTTSQHNHSSKDTTSLHHDKSQKSEREHIHRFDKFYPPSYKLEEEKECKGDEESIIIRIFSKDNSKLRVIVFGVKTQELIFNEERSFTTTLDDMRDDEEKRKFLKNEIQNFLHIHRKRYCREEIWHHVKTSDGKYKDGGYYKLISEKFEYQLRTKVYINDKHYKRSREEEQLEFKDAELIDIRAKEIHELLAKEYSEIEKEVQFPVSVTWLNSILKRLPFYKNKPIYAFYLFLSSLIFIFLGLTYFSDTFSPKITSKNVDKKWIKHAYYAGIAEPLWGILAQKCEEGAEVNWIINGKRDRRFNKECREYCHVKVKIINNETCDRLFPNRLKTEEDISEKRYQVIIDSSPLGATTPPKIITFINNTSNDIAVTVMKVDIKGEDNKRFPGILESMRGGKTFSIYAKDNYGYAIVFNSSFIGQLKKEQTKADITFKITFKDQSHESVTKEILLEIQ